MSQNLLDDDVTRAGVYRSEARAEYRSKYPQLPKWYRPTSFTVADDVNIDTLLNSLKKRSDADCVSKDSSVVEGVIYDSSANVSFQINFFENTAAETVVEIARRSGCSIRFNEFFTAMQSSFAKDVVVQKKDGFGVTPAFMGLSDEAASPEETASLLSDATNIASSRVPTTSAEGFNLIAATASDARHASNVSTILTAEGAETPARLKAALEAALSLNAEVAASVRVAASAAVAELAQLPAALPWVASNGFVETMTSLGVASDSSLGELEKKELLRQVARCVARALAASAHGNVTADHINALVKHFAVPSCKRDEDVASDLTRSVSCTQYSKSCKIGPPPVCVCSSCC